MRTAADLERVRDSKVKELMSAHSFTHVKNFSENKWQFLSVDGHTHSLKQESLVLKGL